MALIANESTPSSGSAAAKVVEIERFGMSAILTKTAHVLNLSNKKIEFTINYFKKNICH